MSIGNKPAYPHVEHGTGGYRHLNPGMSYRQWLIGQALAGACTACDPAGAGWGTIDVAQQAIQVADDIVAALDAEEKSEASA